MISYRGRAQWRRATEATLRRAEQQLQHDITAIGEAELQQTRPGRELLHLLHAAGTDSAARVSPQPSIASAVLAVRVAVRRAGTVLVRHRDVAIYTISFSSIVLVLLTLLLVTVPALRLPIVGMFASFLLTFGLVQYLRTWFSRRRPWLQSAARRLGKIYETRVESETGTWKLPPLFPEMDLGISWGWSVAYTVLIVFLIILVIVVPSHRLTAGIALGIFVALGVSFRKELMASGRQLLLTFVGQSVYLPQLGQKAGTTTFAMRDINTADRRALQALLGVSPTMARKIVKYRKAHGPFSSPEDLAKVPGIGDLTADKLGSHLKDRHHE
jgi:competence ComEA-like helix-hairpin-helix protein